MLSMTPRGEEEDDTQAKAAKAATATAAAREDSAPESAPCPAWWRPAAETPTPRAAADASSVPVPAEARSIHWSPYDGVRVVNAVP